MNEPIFLTLEEVLQIHADMLASFGGREGVRDISLLESAIATPRSGFGGEFFYKDIPSMAAAYLFYIAKNHALVDGNKRTAAAAAIVFLKMNNIVFQAKRLEIAELTEALVCNNATKEDAIAFFMQRIECAE